MASVYCSMPAPAVSKGSSQFRSRRGTQPIYIYLLPFSTSTTTICSTPGVPLPVEVHNPPVAIGGGLKPPVEKGEQLGQAGDIWQLVLLSRQEGVPLLLCFGPG